MSRIIAALDNSAAARPVVVAAAGLAALLGATVEAVNVGDIEGHTAAACAASCNVAFRTIPGDPLAGLVALAAEDDVVAIAIGQRSRPGKGRAGHLVLALADATDKPVLVVPPQALPSGEVNRVVIAMEGTGGKARELARTVELAAATHLELIVVHVDDESSIPSFSDQVQHETDAFAREFLARNVRGAPEARLELRIGLPVDEILAACDDLTPELVAMGWPHSPDPGRGEVARAVVARSTVPVLLVATR